MWNLLNIWVAFEQMMEDVLVKLSAGLLWLKLHSIRRGLFLLARCIGIEEEASEVLRLVLKLGGFGQ